MDTKVIPMFVRRMAEKHGLADVDMSYQDLVAHALQKIRYMNGSAEIVCGPITTGGFGHPGYNTLPLQSRD